MSAARATSDRYAQDTAALGMVIFMASWAMLFASLFFAYGIIRLRTPAWPPPDLPRIPLGIPSLATLALAASSVLLERGRRGVRTRTSLTGAWLGGALFLALACIVWRVLWQGGLRPDTGTYASVFYGLTVFHALHVAVGLAGVAWTAIRRSAALRLWTMYWHMVGAIWGVTFLLVYVI